MTNDRDVRARMMSVDVTNTENGSYLVRTYEAVEQNPKNPFSSEVGEAPPALTQADLFLLEQLLLELRLHRPE